MVEQTGHIGVLGHFFHGCIQIILIAKKPHAENISAQLDLDHGSPSRFSLGMLGRFGNERSARNPGGCRKRVDESGTATW